MAADPNQPIISQGNPPEPARRADRSIAWSVDDASELYQVNAWGKGYFCVNPAGHLVVRPGMDASREIDLFDVVQGLKERELTTPVVVRFSDILAHRLKHLHDAFAQAIAENDFSENYRLLKIRAEMELGRYAEALKSLDEGLKRFPQSLQLRWLGREVCQFNRLPERAGKLDVEFTQMIQQGPWRYTDPVNQVVIGKFYLSQGIDPKKVLENIYNVVKKRQPTYVDVYLASGELALE